MSKKLSLPIAISNSLLTSEKMILRQLISTAKNQFIEFSSVANEKGIRGEFIAWLLADNEYIECLNPRVITLNGYSITGKINLRAANITRPICFSSCTLNHSLILNEAQIKTIEIIKTITSNITLESAHINGDIIITSLSKVFGELSLFGSYVDGSVKLSGSQIINKNNNAINADLLKCKGNVILGEGFISMGEVTFSSAEIRGDLDLNGSRIINKNRNAIRVNNSKIGSNIFFSGGFRSLGEVNLKNSHVSGNLELDGATIIGSDRASLHADALDCEGSIFIRGGTTLKGGVRLLGARIKRNLQLYDCKLEANNTIAFDGQGMKVEGTLTWRDMLQKPIGKVQLNPASVGMIVDDEQSWPTKENLYLDGLTYSGFSGGAPTSASTRLEWLRLHPINEFRLQPYEQLTKVLRSMGHNKDAVTIAINKNRDYSKSGQLSFLASLWSSFLSATIDYGYTPSKVIVRFILPIIILGALCFDKANESGVMYPSKERVYMAEEKGKDRPKAYPKFNPIIYSIDAFIPVFDLHQEVYWLPNANIKNGAWYRTYLWIHIVTGWIFSTLTVVALTGIIKRD